MRVAQEQVEIFHQMIGELIHEKPTLIEGDHARRRADFIIEEAKEYLDALEANDLVGVADALADMLYVVLGAAVAHGIDIQPIFNEVHRSNMTKTPKPGTMKLCEKGPGYQKPRIAELLFLQNAGLEAHGD